MWQRLLLIIFFLLTMSDLKAAVVTSVTTAAFDHIFLISISDRKAAILTWCFANHLNPNPLPNPYPNYLIQTNFLAIFAALYFIGNDICFNRIKSIGLMKSGEQAAFIKSRQLWVNFLDKQKVKTDGWITTKRENWTKIYHEHI